VDLNLSNRVCVITGASRGIGAATARALRAEGARLLLVARDGTALGALVQELGGESGGVRACEADLSRADGAARVVAEAVAAFGRVDGLVACAGATVGGDPLALRDDAWRSSFELKFFGTIRLIQAVVPVMAEHKRGVVLIVGGNIGRQPNAMMLPGSAVNAALHSIARGYAERLAADGIRVHVLNPGPTRTERLQRYVQMLAEKNGTSLEAAEALLVADAPQRRVAEPAEMAALAAFMLSDRFACATGNQVTADGGWVRSAT
jgi:NAD(P)-dependent dehydrogenase (short-subunit alcohol dehydrogenase family)